MINYSDIKYSNNCEMFYYSESKHSVTSYLIYHSSLPLLRWLSQASDVKRCEHSNQCNHPQLHHKIYLLCLSIESMKGFDSEQLQKTSPPDNLSTCVNLSKLPCALVSTRNYWGLHCEKINRLLMGWDPFDKRKQTDINASLLSDKSEHQSPDLTVYKYIIGKLNG